MPIDVSIIIPIYNVEEYVEACVKSVMRQNSRCQIECILVNDKSQDASIEIVRSCLTNYSGPIKFKVIEREVNGGLSAARNSGLKLASGKYIFFLDSDDYISEDCISTLFKMTEIHPNVEIVEGALEIFPKKKTIFPGVECKDLPEYCNDKHHIRKFWLEGFPLMAWNRLILRSFLQGNNLYFKEGLIHEDNHWQANAYFSISSVAYVDKVTYYYRKREDSIMANQCAQSRRKRAFIKILSEMSMKSKEQWDKPWIVWLSKYLYWLKKNTDDNDCGTVSRNDISCIINNVLRNPCVSKQTRVGFLYFYFPARLLKWKILCKVLGI